MDSDFRPPKRSRESTKTSQNKPKIDTLLSERRPFKTPDEVATEEALKDVSQSVKSDTEMTKKNPVKRNLWQKLDLHWPPGNREFLIAGIIIVLIAGVTSWAIIHRKMTINNLTGHHKKYIPKDTKPKTVASNLSGLQVDPSVNKRPVTGVMIENSLDSRPQSGLSQASVVFEAIAEGGITRFLALYQDNTPDDVGPIRSARPYYIQWLLGFDAGYAHVGGSPEAISDIGAWGVRDLDQFYNGGSYHRISSRAAPHNVYTGIATLNQLETAKGYTSSSFTSLVRKTPPKATKVTSKTKSKTAVKVPAPAAKTIDLRLSGALYNVHYDYVAATNTYSRSEGGAAHIDANGNVQLSPTVVVALVMTYGIQSDGKHSDYATIGDGTAYIFQDGGVSIGHWTKSSEKAQFSFTDDAGKPIPLSPGQTWFTAVSSTDAVTYAP